MTTKQVILDNGKGQGAYGLADSWTEAIANARGHWRWNFSTQKPTRVRRLELAASGAIVGQSPETPFVSWAALEREAQT
jgi:hypothetical protein